MPVITVRTNNQERDVLFWDQLTKKEQADMPEFDGREEGEYVRYKGSVYYMGDFQRMPEGFEAHGKWHGYISDSYFSGILLRLTGEGVVMGTYIS